MKQFNTRVLKTLALLALLASTVPVTIMALWIKAFNLGDTQEERGAIFYSYLPEFLHSRWSSTYLSIAFCIVALLLSGMSMKLPGSWWRALSILILTVSGALLLLNVFSLM